MHWNKILLLKKKKGLYGDDDLCLLFLIRYWASILYIIIRTIRIIQSKWLSIDDIRIILMTPRPTSPPIRLSLCVCVCQTNELTEMDQTGKQHCPKLLLCFETIECSLQCWFLGSTPCHLLIKAHLFTEHCGQLCTIIYFCNVSF